MYTYKVSFGPVDFHRYTFTCLDKSGIKNWCKINKVNIPYLSNLEDLFQIFLQRNVEELSFEFEHSRENIIFFIKKEKIY